MQQSPQRPLTDHLHFDAQDYAFLDLIQKTMGESKQAQSVRSRDEAQEAELFFADLHPNGIVELAMPGEMRIASAVLHLLDTLKKGQEDERLKALLALKESVLVSARTTLRHNTARVLIQIMKEIVRSTNFRHQLCLAHDFRQAATGKPSVVRHLLRRYYLLEMPEEWNQAVFDHHVHDANTKGRKNATHLIMDAWIKGIRSLTVIYYNYVAPEAARELLTAAEIMGITVRIGLLFHAPFHEKFVDFIWIPRGFSDAQGFLNFLDEAPMRRLMEEGHKATKWLENNVLAILEYWNTHDRFDLSEELAIICPILEKDAFMEFVGNGQASLSHLAEFIQKSIYPLLSEKIKNLYALGNNTRFADLPAEIQAEIRILDNYTAETFIERLNNSGPICPPAAPAVTGEAQQTVAWQSNPPEILRLPPLVLLDWLTSIYSGNRVILNLAGLTTEDVLNLLWDCQGLITHLEIFNLKDWQEGKAKDIQGINRLQRAINAGRGPHLKQMIRTMIRECENPPLPSCPLTGENGSALCLSNAADISHGPSLAAPPTCEERAEKLRLILRSMPSLLGFYKSSKLYTRMGTDSTSRPGRRYGMGLVYPETLPRRAQKEIRNSTNSSRLRLPLRTEVVEHISYHATNTHFPRLFNFLRSLPFCSHIGLVKKRDYQPMYEHPLVCNNGQCSSNTRSRKLDQGNVFTLGGIGKAETNGFVPEEKKHGSNTPTINTNLANALKILAGFIPALLTFLYVQSWWVLAWFGAPLWFLITGLRNIVQAVLGGGGFRRSPMLRWNNYVSWSRLADSLMYTGFSVPILELGVRVMLLENTFGITSANAPVLTFTWISIINGFYISAHNYVRGLQKEAIIGNLFRSFFAIPIAVLYNAIAIALLTLAGHANAAALLLPVAAIISKIASDTVACLIEGVADRNSNVRLREWDYENTLGNIFQVYAKLELLYPEQSVLDLLDNPRELMHDIEEKATSLRTALIIHALDLMYFWFYQPRATNVLEEKIQRFSSSERLVFLRTQNVLSLEREVSQLFVDGLVGHNFAHSLSFYLDKHPQYLQDMRELIRSAKQAYVVE